MLTDKQHKELLKRWNERVSWIQGQNFSIAENATVQKERIALAKKDYAYFVQTYFPHLANKPCGSFQINAANYVLKNNHSRALFEWARGHAKSTHISLLIPLWLKIQDPRQLNVMILVSASQDSAIRLLSDLQAELQYNELFTKDFGKQMQQGTWAEGEFYTTDGCMFIALGRGQSPRGLKDRGKRPDYIVIDDIDDDELVRNPSRVSKVLEWCKSALIGSMAMGRGRFTMVGNRIAKDSVLVRMAASKGIHHTIVNALDKNQKPTWHQNYTAAEIEQLRAFQGERLFQKEYMNNPISEGTVFSAKDIIYIKILPLHKYKTLICYTDPSFKDSPTADYKATILVGKSPEGQYHIIKVFVDKTSASNMVQWHYDIDKEIKGRVPVLYYMEANFLQDLILAEFKTAGNIIGSHIPVRPDNRKKPDKFSRIEALQPLFNRHLIAINQDIANSAGLALLKEQLLMFEKGSKAHDDAPDALEGAIWLLNNRTKTQNAAYRAGLKPSRKF